MLYSQLDCTIKFKKYLRETDHRQPKWKSFGESWLVSHRKRTVKTTSCVPYVIWRAVLLGTWTRRGFRKDVKVKHGKVIGVSLALGQKRIAKTGKIRRSHHIPEPR
jgi:hypothetical protein